MQNIINNSLKFIFLTSIATLTTGCASIVTGTVQPVSVQTVPRMGATCSLENNKGKWYVSHTPGTVMIQRSFNDLEVTCDSPGYFGQRRVASNTKVMAFGNVIFGGVVGAGVDMADGAAYDYPADIIVRMNRK